MKDIGIYVHIPFCKSKCYYCDFNSYTNKNDLIENYVKALIDELSEKSSQNYRVNTIFIGGGTPSYIDERYIISIINQIKQNYYIIKDAEITIEANPGTVNKNKLEEYKKIGINRISIGLQTSNNEILKKIGRIHTFEQYLETIELVKKVGFKNINSDIIIGLPGQTIEDVNNTLKELIKLEIEHISVYSLIVEEGTKIKKMILNKEMTLPAENIERKMYWMAKKLLERSGYKHYEISNFSKPGFSSKHNLDCWNQKEYLGVGVSASSYIDGVRFSNISCSEEYINNINNKQFSQNTVTEEIQNKEDMQNEFMMLGLRKIDGVSIDDFINKFGTSPISIYKEKINNLEAKGLIEIKNNNIQLSDSGIDLANLVWQEFV